MKEHAGFIGQRRQNRVSSHRMNLHPRSPAAIPQRSARSDRPQPSPLTSEPDDETVVVRGQERDGAMAAANSSAVLRERLGADAYEALEELIEMRQQNLLTVDRFERRMAELRTELLKWAMVSWAAYAGAVAAIVGALR
jgi:hypothetical protein